MTTSVAHTKPCTKCGGTGDGVKDPIEGTLPCERCAGAGRIPATVKRAAFAPKWGELVLELTAAGVRIREKKRRTWYGPVPYGEIMQRGAAMAAAERMAAKRARKRK